MGSSGRKVWGLTGGIASGKTTAARIFAETGIPVIDADEIAREMSAPDGPAHEAIQKRFGTVDRMRLRGIVFNDPAARKDLEAIVHPLIQAESRRRIEAAQAPHVLYEAALLVETGRYRDFDGLIVVDAPRDLRLHRLIFRDRMPPDLAEKMLQSQISDEERRKAATVLIDNSGTEADLRQQVTKFLKTHRW